MNIYNIYQWSLFFYIYCFFGWCIESAIVSISDRKLINRGFLSGPLLPIYGTGAILVLFITLPCKDNIIAVYFVGMIGATILEYITGWLMELIFKVKYWDYSYRKNQYKGRICLISSLFWGILSILLTELIHNPIESYVLSLNQSFVIISSIIITFVAVMDTITSIKATIDINKLMEQSENTLNQIKELKEEIEFIINNTTGQIYYLKDRNEREISELTNRIKESVNTIKEKIEVLSNGIKKETTKFGFIKERLVKGHPTGYSTKFNYSYRDLKEDILSRHLNVNKEIEDKRIIFFKKLEQIKNSNINKK